MSKLLFGAACAAGLALLGWTAVGLAASGPIALVVTGVIAAAYLLGALELQRFRAATAALAAALHELAQPPAALADWLARVPAALRGAVRARIEGERGALPGPALTPSLVGLLVMLGMLGTFLGMIATFRGAVFALEGSSDLQAVRAALAAPIKGLGLAFGTSVAGVAASAMLGLMSAIARRERIEVTRQLDGRIATALAPFSAAHQRQETLHALQLQARALPQVVDALSAMMQRIEGRSRQLDDQLSERQGQFQREVTLAYSELARSVGASLQEHLAATGDRIAPVVASAMGQVVQESQRLYDRLGDAAQAQVDVLSRQFGATADLVSANWASALQTHARTSETMAGELQRALASFTQGFERRSGELLATVDEHLDRARSQQAAAERERLQAWTGALEATGAQLQEHWRRAGEETIAQHAAVCAALQRAGDEIAERAAAQAARTLDEVGGLLAQSQELVRARADGEARWLEQQGQHMDRLAALWRSELAALRDEEGRRGAAAVERLDELQAAVARHLAALGAALEAPLTRLLHTASEVPQAAAGVITQLRAEMSRVTERDNVALQERTALLEQLRQLLHAVNQAAGDQQAATQSLVAAATGVVEQAGVRFAHALDAQAARGSETATQIAGSAVELSSLAEAFGHGVELFQASNERMIETLLRIEASLGRSTARSDEQLAYYVAQAREVIDLSIASQHGLVENLRQLQGTRARAAALAQEERA